LAQLLVIDDEPEVRNVLREILLRDGHQVETAEDGLAARRLIGEAQFELVLCDVNLPGEWGLDLVRDIAAAHRDVAVVMVTGVDDPSLADLALELGAYGYVVKPFRQTELVIAVANALRRRRLEIENRSHREHLERLVGERTAALHASREETIRRLAAAAEARHHETGQHIERVARVVDLLARELGLERERRELLRIASPLHDIGKIAVPDHILLKPGTLTPDERVAMQAHAERGYQMLAGSGEPMLEVAATIALTHHERWDGSGYPWGLIGEAIPLEGRIVAVVDVFDALLSHRSYRPAVPLDETVQRLRQGRETHFDPNVLDGFLDVLPEALVIREQFADDHRTRSCSSPAGSRRDCLRVVTTLSGLPIAL
jgi:putative two-component system response regulator